MIRRKVVLLLVLCGIMQLVDAAKITDTKKAPNILWITCEDISPYFGCYGDKNADTPAIDNLARQGMKYTNAYANAPVCAPARFTLIAGMYASSCGTHNMRSKYKIPSSFKTYPELLREAGYYCTNNSKQDYNSKSIKTSIWDESSKTAHYKNRKSGQPFFAVFNLTITHEGKSFKYDPDELIHNPDSMIIPPYHPDVKEVRQNWAKLYDNITKMDSQVNEILEELEELNLVDSTIIFFYSDHGGVLPRSKRFIYSTGTKVPLIINVPEMYKNIAETPENSTNDRLVSFVDFAPTVLSLAGIEKPANMQGTTFLGRFKEEEPEYVYFFRGRMDERHDLMLGICNKQYRYIYNFMPDLPYSQHLSTLWKSPTAKAWERAYKENRCNEIQKIFWNVKPVSELYNMIDDPWEVSNLANNKEFSDIKKKLEEELLKFVIGSRDASLISEADLVNINDTSVIYDYTHAKDYPHEKITNLAFLSADKNSDNITKFKKELHHKNPIVRYWSVAGLAGLIPEHPELSVDLLPFINDESESVSILVAGGLCKSDKKNVAIARFKELLKSNNSQVVLSAINMLQNIAEEDIIENLRTELMEANENGKTKYIKRSASYILEAYP